VFGLQDVGEIVFKWLINCRLGLKAPRYARQAWLPRKTKSPYSGLLKIMFMDLRMR